MRFFTVCIRTESGGYVYLIYPVYLYLIQPMNNKLRADDSQAFANANKLL